MFHVSLVSLASWRCSVPKSSSWNELLFTGIAILTSVSLSPHIIRIEVEITGLALSRTSKSCARSLSLNRATALGNQPAVLNVVLSDLMHSFVIFRLVLIEDLW